jgi:RNA polymerase sigma-70 factor (ECF subfamily)
VAAQPDNPNESESVVETTELVERARSGDRAAFGLLYDRFAPTLQGVAERLLPGVRERRERDDLMHDVFLEAWQHIREYDPARAPFRTWLLLRLRSRASDLRNRAEARHTRLAEGDEMEASMGAPQEHELEQRSVRAALHALEPEVRAVLELTYFDGWTAREIAERKDVPLGTVKSRLARGLGVLAAALRERGEAHDE